MSLAVKGALFNTRLPKVEAAIMDGGNIELSLSEDPYECVRLHVDSVPILVTICKIGEHCIVDPSSEEEVCSLASLVVGVSVRNGTGTFIAHKWIGSCWPLPISLVMCYNCIVFFYTEFITNIRTNGAGSFHTETLNRCLELGKMAGKCLDSVLLKVLRQEEENVGVRIVSRKDICGFLR